MTNEPIPIDALKPEEVPDCLKVETYFDFQTYPFAHQALFTGPDIACVLNVIPAISGYAKGWLADTIAQNLSSRDDLEVRTDTVGAGAQAWGRFRVVLEEGAIFEPGSVMGITKPDAEPHTIYLAAGASVLGTDIYLDGGDIYIGEGTTVEPGVGLKGATIIGADNEIRQGSYFRGDVIVGDGGTFRGELKNVVMMNKANFPHPSYVGDSLCGYATHFGNQATAANLGIFEGLRESSERRPLIIRTEEAAYVLGGPKLGVILGDWSQVGCNSVADPGTFLAPHTIVYSLTRLDKGFYGPDEVVKNKPMAHGVIERAALT